MDRIRIAPAFVYICILSAAPGVWAAEQTSAAEDQAHAQAINNALGRATAIEGSIADYRRRHDDFPSSNADAGIGPASGYANADIKRISVGPMGVVEITLTATSGVDDGVIVLKPAKSQQTEENDVQWACASASYSTISDVTKGVCEYTKLP